MLELAQAPARSDRARVRVLAAIEAGPAAVLPAACASATLTGAIGLAILAGGPTPRFASLVTGALGVLLATGLAGLAVAALHRRRGRPVALAVTSERDGDGAATTRRDLATAALLAATVVVPALLAPVHYLVAAARPPSTEWLAWGFLDRRWATSAFVIATVAPAVALVVAARVVATAHGQPPSWRCWAQAIVGGGGDPGKGAPPWGGHARRGRSTAVKVLAGVLVAAWFFAPPWYVARGQIGYHETQMMQGVQAIDTGSLPYIDAAANQYGPGTEAATYAFAKVSGQMSVDGLRRASLLFTWVAATLLFVALYVRVRPLVATATCLAAVAVFPALQMFHRVPGGAFEAFWGWANLLRYAGVALVALLLPPLLTRARSRARRAAGAAALGAGWALLCLVAQENLIGGVLVASILAVLLVASQTATARATVTALAGLALGFAAVAAPVLALYALHGQAGRFLDLYWLMPHAVSSGYSNTPWGKGAGLNTQYAALYRALPLLLAVLLLAALLVRRPLRVATGWTDRRVVLVSVLVAALVCHLGALTRASGWHLVNTELVLPAALCVAAADLPRELGFGSVVARWAGGVAIALVTLALLPLSPASLPRAVAESVSRPLEARRHAPPSGRAPAGMPAASVAAARVGAGTLRQPICCQRPLQRAAPLPMREFVGFLDRLHAIVGTRRVYVDRTPSVNRPGIYFLADLRPAPMPADFGTMVLNDAMRAQWRRTMRARMPRIQALVTTDRARWVPRTWLRAHRAHRAVTVPYGPRHVAFVLLAA